MAGQSQQHATGGASVLGPTKTGPARTGPVKPPRPAGNAGKGTKGGSHPGASNPLFDPNATLTGQPLNRAAHQIANAQTNGPIMELAKARAQQLAQGAAAQKLTSGYFNQLGQFAQQGLTAQTGIANDLNSQLQSIADQTQQKLQGMGQGQVTSLENHVGGDFLGAGLPSLANTLTNNAGTATNNAQAFRSFGATQGANYRGLAAANLGAFAERGQEDLTGIGKATRFSVEPLNAKMAALRAQNGALYGTALGSLRQQERNYGLARGALGLKQASLNATVAQDNAKNKIALASINLRARIAAVNAQLASGRLTETQRHNLQSEKTSLMNAQANLTRAAKAGTGGSGSGKAPSAASQNVVVRRVSSITARVNELASQFEHWGASPASAASQAWHALHTGSYWGKNAATGKWSWQYISPVGDTGLLNAAYNVRNGGTGLTSGDLAYLKKQGLANPGSRFTVARTVPNTPSTRTIGNAGGAAGGLTF